MAEYLEYARGLRRQLDDFLDETGIKLQPALQLVVCGFDPQHYVPATSLESHARLRHRAKHYTSAESHAFFYRRDPSDVDKTEATHSEPLDDELVTGDGDSLVDSLTPLAQDGVLASLQAVAKDSSELYAAVGTWRRIPRAFAQLGLSGDVAADRAKLERWIKSELARLQELAPDTVDGEMIEYVLGLLEHPEFCHPDLLVVELEEFLGSGEARAFVAALWKFMIIDVGLRVLPTAATPLPSVSEKIASVNGTEAVRVPNADSNTPSNSDYKRRRPSYRAKSTRAGPYDMMREILAKSMAQLSEETGRELVELPDRLSDASKRTGAHKPWGRAVTKDWSECTDSLRVRDMGRELHRDPQTIRRRSPPRRPGTNSHHRSKSRSRDRRDRRSQDRHRDLDRDRRRDRHGDRERNRDRDRDRERGRQRDYDRRQHHSRHRS